MYQIQKQYIPGVDQLWVLRLNEQDTIQEFEDYASAIDRANELQTQDETGRKYRVVEQN